MKDLYIVNKDGEKLLSVIDGSSVTYLNINSPDFDKSLTLILLGTAVTVLSGILSSDPKVMYKGVPITVPCYSSITIVGEVILAYYGIEGTASYQELTTNTLYALIRDRIANIEYKMKDIDIAQTTKETSDRILYIGGFH